MKRLREGISTGSCMTAGALASVLWQKTGHCPEWVEIETPIGRKLKIEIHPMEFGTCWVRKDGGDDPDVTDGCRIITKVELLKEQPERIVFVAGKGVGKVTRPGLSLPVGEPAINPVPRKMVREHLVPYLEREGAKVTVCVPDGEKIAQKTLNPKLGVLGGISILGTSGIVEPMSERALICSIQVEMKQQFENGSRYLLVTPGNYGAAYLKEHMDLPFETSVKCSNYVGETVDMAVDMGVEGILFVAHIGKFVKVAGGIMNTHSRCADARAELMAANALRAGASAETACRILKTVTTDEALAILKEAGCLEGTIQEITDRISASLKHRSYGRILTGAVIFSNEYGYLGKTEEADTLIKYIEEQEMTKERHS